MMTNDFLRLEHAWDCTEQSEIILVRSAQSGNLEAFNALILKYQDMMYRTALRILGQDALAEDATQDAFISAYQHIIELRGGSLKSWFMWILVNKCYDDIRRIHRTAAISLNESFTDDGENESLYIRFQDHVPSVEECVETSERNEYIQKCLSKLPTDYRVVLVLVDIEEMSYGEASTILKIPMGTVKSRLARARLSLRRELKAANVC
ncbi:MAG TPA: sigma-70 family RNA polymerase sigma factor [Anaerolineales bacterium]|nr:sigma-70 family RNA polymerase sigma factor [Anaerolineales bacterium]